MGTVSAGQQRDNFIFRCGHRRYGGDRCHVNTWRPGHCSGPLLALSTRFCWFSVSHCQEFPQQEGPAWAHSSKHSQQQNLHSLQETLSMQILTNVWLAFVWDPWWIRMIMFDKEVSSLQNFRRWMKISVQIYLWNSIMCIQWSKMSTLWSPGLCCATMMVKTMARHDLHCDNMVRDRLQED